MRLAQTSSFKSNLTVDITSPDLLNELNVYDKNFEDIFVILIIQLNLSDMKKKLRFSLFFRTSPYSFQVQRAMRVMNELCLKLDLKVVSTTISYSVKANLAFGLLEKFFLAHLLHDPYSRTSSSLVGVDFVQVTPKGAALVYQFCKNIGMQQSKMPPIVRSDFNTMRLFGFERSTVTNKALHSEYLNRVLLVEAMGLRPNVWSPDANCEPAKNLYYNDKSNLEFDINSTGTSAYYSCEELFETQNLVHTSPLHHRYFSNPESDAHIQYYESVSGCRVFGEKVLVKDGFPTKFENCFSGKALVQWLLDCTTLYTIAEAKEICQVMLNQNLFVAVTVSGSVRRFHNHRDALYVLSDLGRNLCRWNVTERRPDEEPRELEKLERILLRTVVKDPGMRYLFRMHLEKEKCAENIEVYSQLERFNDQRKRLNQILRHHELATDDAQKQRLLLAAGKIANTNFLMAFHLYSKYFSLESRLNLNIDFMLQQEVNVVMSSVKGSPLSPVKVKFYDISAYAQTPVMETFNLRSDLDSQSILSADGACQSLGKRQSSPSVSKNTEETLISESSKSKEHSIQKPIKNSIAVKNEKEIGHQQFVLENGPESATLMYSISETIESLDKIWQVFGKISQSLYRLMEVDSYPKFVASEEYVQATGSLTQWS